MITKKITQAQVDELIEKIIDSWDMDDLVSYASDRLESYLTSYTDEEFMAEWNVYFDEEE